MPCPCKPCALSVLRAYSEVAALAVKFCICWLKDNMLLKVTRTKYCQLLGSSNLVVVETSLKRCNWSSIIWHVQVTTLCGRLFQCWTHVGHGLKKILPCIKSWPLDVQLHAVPSCAITAGLYRMMATTIAFWQLSHRKQDHYVVSVTGISLKL